MKISKSQLKQIIKEELSKGLDEGLLDMFKGKSGAEEEMAAIDASTQQQMAKFEPVIKQITDIVTQRPSLHPDMSRRATHDTMGKRIVSKKAAASKGISPELIKAALEKSAEIIATSENKKELSRFARYLQGTLVLFKGDGTRYGKIGRAIGGRGNRGVEIEGSAQGELNRILGFYNSMVAAIPAIAGVLPKPNYRAPHANAIYYPDIPRG